MSTRRRNAVRTVIAVAVLAGAVVGVQQLESGPSAKPSTAPGQTGAGQVSVGQAGPSPSPLPGRATAAATLNPDGSVPWVDEPAVDADFRLPVTPPPAPTGPPCQAGQLRGALPKWIHKSTGGEAFNPTLDASLYGFAVLTNTSGSACTVHGVPSLHLAANGVAVPLDHTGTSSQGSVVGLPPGGQADFRIDWDAPYCAQTHGPYTLTADLPTAGTVPVALLDQTAPGCVHEENHPGLASSLSPGPITWGNGETHLPPASPLSGLKAGIEGAPATVHAGEAVQFVVVLSNPTASAIPLAGRPGLALETFCSGTQGRTGLNETRSYLLNNRPVHEIPAHGSVRFTMVDQLPPGTPIPGPTLIITWRLLDLGLSGDLPYAVVQIPTAG